MKHDYWVLKGDKPCHIVKDSISKHGVLVPYADGEIPAPIGQNYATGKRRALAAIARTRAIADKWRSSILSDWAKVKHLRKAKGARITECFSGNTEGRITYDLPRHDPYVKKIKTKKPVQTQLFS